MADDRITVTLITANKNRRAEVRLSPSTTVADLIAECQRKWSLPNSVDYTLMDRSRNQQLLAKQTLTAAGVADGATLEIQPLPEAGGYW